MIISLSLIGDTQTSTSCLWSKNRSLWLRCSCYVAGLEFLSLFLNTIPSGPSVPVGWAASVDLFTVWHLRIDFMEPMNWVLPALSLVCFYYFSLPATFQCVKRPVCFSLSAFLIAQIKEHHQNYFKLWSSLMTIRWKERPPSHRGANS